MIETASREELSRLIEAQREELAALRAALELEQRDHGHTVRAHDDLEAEREALRPVARAAVAWDSAYARYADALAKADPARTKPDRDLARAAGDVGIAVDPLRKAIRALPSALRAELEAAPA